MIALLATVWAAIEIQLGILLRTINTPFRGLILTFFALIILFLGRNMVPKRGVVFLMGLTAAFMKFLFLGGIAIYPVIAISIESFLVELCLFHKPPGKLQFYLAGALGMGWSFLNPFLTKGLLAGWGILKVYQMLIENGASLLGIKQQAFGVFIMLFGLHLVLGVIAGIFGCKFSRLIIRRYNGFVISE